MGLGGNGYVWRARAHLVDMGLCQIYATLKRLNSWIK